MRRHGNRWGQRLLDMALIGSIGVGVLITMPGPTQLTRKWFKCLTFSEA
jgi:hypothetical protein